jgi:hypothetical protein
MQARLDLVLLAGCVIGVVTAAGVPAPASQAQKPPMSDAAYEKVMKEIGSTFRSLQINNKVMNHADGEREARRLATWFRDVQAYWEAKKVEDAAGFARSAVAAAQQIEKSSAAMQMDVLQDAERTLATACESCHKAHRERLPDGSFRIR